MVLINMRMAEDTPVLILYSNLTRFAGRLSAIRVAKVISMYHFEK